MKPLPANNLRHNLGTWAVPACRLPAATALLLGELPRETFDPDFRGQALATTYLDTPSFRLRKARRRGDRYLTLRLRCYRGAAGETYALAAKTEAQKWRREVDADTAGLILQGPSPLGKLLPADLLARLLELAGDRPVGPVVAVCCRRFAVENDADRLTLDVDVCTDAGKCLPFAVLEFKSTDGGATPPAGLSGLGLRPVKLSKFLWATEV
jgi:hypothetical protein